MQDHLPRDVTVYSELSPPTSTISQGNILTDLSIDQCFGGVFSEVLLFRYVLACAKLSQTNHHSGTLDHLIQCKSPQVSDKVG